MDRYAYLEPKLVEVGPSFVACVLDGDLFEGFLGCCQVPKASPTKDGGDREHLVCLADITWTCATLIHDL